MINPFGSSNSPLFCLQVPFLRKGSAISILLYLLIAPLISAVSWYVGTAYTGWQVGGSQVVRLTVASGFAVSSMMYVSMICLVLVVGLSMCWMNKTYGSRLSPIKAIEFSSYISTPFFIIGLCGLYPIFWLDMFLLIVAIVWSLVILYRDMPLVAGISEERAFMFSSAVVAAGVVAFITLMVMSVLFWGLISPPVFTD